MVTLTAKQRIGEYGCGTTFSLSSLGPEFWNSLRNTWPALLPAAINTGFQITNGWPKEKKYHSSFAPVYYEHEEEAENCTAHVSSLSSADLLQKEPFL